MNTSAKVTLCAAMTLLSACQTDSEPASLPKITGIDRTIYVDATCASGKAILISQADILTLETAEQIGDHNADLWCKCPEKRPASFNASICKV